jgi:hypothetical protein
MRSLRWTSCALAAQDSGTGATGEPYPAADAPSPRLASRQEGRDARWPTTGRTSPVSALSCPSTPPVYYRLVLAADERSAPTIALQYTRAGNKRSSRAVLQCTEPNRP